MSATSRETPKPSFNLAIREDGVRVESNIGFGPIRRYPTIRQVQAAVRRGELSDELGLAYQQLLELPRVLYLSVTAENVLFVGGQRSAGRINLNQPTREQIFELVHVLSISHGRRPLIAIGDVELSLEFRDWLLDRQAAEAAEKLAALWLRVAATIAEAYRVGFDVGKLTAIDPLLTEIFAGGELGNILVMDPMAENERVSDIVAEMLARRHRAHAGPRCLGPFG